MKITAEKLQAHNACQEGVDAFARAFPEGIDVAEWTPEYQIGVMMHNELRMYLGWAWAVGVLPQWSMRGWRLTRANLTDADLTRADLTRANLTRADLAGARWDDRPPPAGWICVDGRLRRAA